MYYCTLNWALYMNVPDQAYITDQEERATRTWMPPRATRETRASLRPRTSGKHLAAATPWSSQPRSPRVATVGPLLTTLPRRRAPIAGTTGAPRQRPTTNTAQETAGRPGTTTGRTPGRRKGKRAPRNLQKRAGIMQTGRDISLSLWLSLSLCHASSTHHFSLNPLPVYPPSFRHFYSCTALSMRTGTSMGLNISKWYVGPIIHSWIRMTGCGIEPD